MADSNIIQCPNCAAQYRLTDQQRQQASGKTVTCKKCQQKFLVPAMSEAPPEVPSYVGAAQPMPMGVPPSQPPYGSPPLADPQFNNPQYPNPQYGGVQQYNALPPSNGMAIAGFVCSAIIIIPLCGLLGIIFSAIGLSRSKRPELHGKGRGLAMAGIFLGIFTLVITPAVEIALVLPVLGRAREMSNRATCRVNLRQIGMMLTLYANENGGRYPNSFGKLMETENVPPSLFICPSSKDKIVPGTTLQQQAANLDSGGYDSYIYLGAGKNSTIDPNYVLAYEPLADHNNAGANFLFNDGRVDWVPRAAAELMISRIKSGQNPPNVQY